MTVSQATQTGPDLHGTVSMKKIAQECRTLSVEKLQSGTLILRFIVPDYSQNVLTSESLTDLSTVLDAIDAAPPPTGLIVASGRENSFFAGADMKRVAGLKSLPREEIERLCDTGRALFHRLFSRPWPTVAVIDGVCLGGGLELALSCDFRVATDSPHTCLGFPEVKLGLLPGWGGTVRLPRLIGVGPAVELIASGESVRAETARQLGLVDAMVPAKTAIESACTLIESSQNLQSHLRRRDTLSSPVAMDPDERGFLEATTAAVILGRTGGHYPAPLSVLRTVVEGSTLPFDQAAALESSSFATLAHSPESMQLIRLFQLGERNRTHSGLNDGRTSKPREIKAPAVIGAGIMGTGIAARHLRSGFSVTLVDSQAESLANGVGGLIHEAAWNRAKKAVDTDRAMELAGKLQTSTRLDVISECDLVIESVVERTDVKKAVLAEIEAVVDENTVIATNTSTNPIQKLAEVLNEPSRFCGIHFFNPVRRMMLVEVVRGPVTSDETVMTAVAHAKKLGKCPVVVKDSPGFLVNRILMPYLHEAVELLREGVSMQRIDRVARDFGMPLGPIELYDMIGLDTAFYAGLVMASAFGDRIDASPVIPALVKSERLGQKTGEGFYRYKKNRDGNSRMSQIELPCPEIPSMLEPYALKPTNPSQSTLIDRLIIPMLLEAIRVLDEEIVQDGRDVDLAVIHALGFPAFRGGILAWGDSIGAKEIVQRLKPLSHLGPRMVPPERLVEMAKKNNTFVSEN